MAKKVMELNSLIHGQFASQTAFARHIGWDKQRLNAIINGKKQPTIMEVQTISEGLGVPFMMVVKFFLNQK